VSWGTTAPPSLRAVLVAAGFLVVAALALKIATLILEPWLTFHPVREYAATPRTLGLPFEDVVLRADDGVRLHAWFVPADRGGPGGSRPSSGATALPALTLLFLHGNAENIGGCLDLALRTREAGHNLLLVDYRGYGESEGRPSEAGLYKDGRAALTYLRSRQGVDPGRIVVWGRSIGAAVAVEAAAGAPAPAGVILESSFTSVPDLLRAGGHGLLFAASLMGTYRFDAAARIGRLSAPLLVVHGTADEIAPFALGRRLFDLAPGAKEFVAIEGGGHNDLWAGHEDEVWAKAQGFLEALR
jgi:fermentation-respiration switch protein FrsA (DUF1100 family)